MTYFIRYTAVSVVEMDLERIDINQCPLSEGNTGPNKYAGTARCREESTEVRGELKSNMNIHFFN